LAAMNSARTVTARATLGGRLADVVRYRELLINLVRLELKAKYKSSALGFVWSLVNPAMYLVIFYIAFQLILRAGIPRFPIYLLSGLLVWNFFTSAVIAGTSSMVSNSGLVKRVWFPREILPLASVGAALVHFFLQSSVLVAALVALRHPVGWAYVPLLPLALFALLVLMAALVLFLSASNVYLRDVQHFVELGLLAWFWVTPIVYQFNQITSHLHGRAGLALLNPITPIVLVFQRAIYGAYGGPSVVPLDAGVAWHLRNLSVVTLAAGLLLLGALHIFGRLEGNLAEEL
jgi:ABC-type polysaccharide/polyol phosphate export permease